MRRHRCSSVPTHSFSATQFREAAENRSKMRETKPQFWVRRLKKDCQLWRERPKRGRSGDWKRSWMRFGEMGLWGSGRLRKRRRQRRQRRQLPKMSWQPQRRNWRTGGGDLGAEKTRMGTSEKPWCFLLFFFGRWRLKWGCVWLGTCYAREIGGYLLGLMRTLRSECDLGLFRPPHGGGSLVAISCCEYRWHRGKFEMDDTHHNPSWSTRFNSWIIIDWISLHQFSLIL